MERLKTFKSQFEIKPAHNMAQVPFCKGFQVSAKPDGYARFKTDDEQHGTCARPLANK
jgi:hypothetical protein